MASRHAVLLTPSLSSRPIQPLSCTQITRETPLIPVFVFKTLRTLSFSVSSKSCVCHSYANGRGGYQQFPTWNESLAACNQLSTFNRVSFPSSHLSLSQRSAKSFTIRTSETPLPQLLYNPHLQTPLVSAGNKGLITPLESALTENSPVTPVESALTESGGWGSFLPLRNSPYATRHYPLCSSPFFSDYSTLFCTFLYISKTQPICFHAVPRSLRKTPGCGGGTLIFPTINAFSSARSPRALPLTLAPAPTYNPAVSSVASQSNFISGSNRMKKSFWMCAAGIVV